MEKFVTLTGVAAPLRLINVDTDMIIPKQFLKTIKRTGLGAHLLEELRYDEEGRERAEFILNRAPYRKAKILIAGENFGCGSSREHAPWALLDFGIRCLIAPSFADIFYNNCFKNGILPVVLAKDTVERLMTFAAKSPKPVLTVDLPSQTVSGGGGPAVPFEIDSFRKRCLVNGLDEIALTLEKAEAIAAFEERQKLRHPWLWT